VSSEVCFDVFDVGFNSSGTRGTRPAFDGGNVGSELSDAGGDDLGLSFSSAWTSCPAVSSARHHGRDFERPDLPATDRACHARCVRAGGRPIQVWKTPSGS
jgi:hypothetical protein